MRIHFMNIATKVLFCAIIWSACQTDKNSMLCKKWKSVALFNQKMDAEISSMQAYIDTVGNLDPTLSKQINIDSLKMLLKAELDNAIMEQQVTLENTIMEFKTNGVIYTTSIQGTDSAMYSIDEENNIVIDEAKLKGFGETMKFKILTLSKDSLRVKIIDYGDTSYVSMIPAKE